MRAQVSGEGVTAAAGIATEWALEGFLACVKLDVSQQVSFLGEGHTALAALKWTITCIHRAKKTKTKHLDLGDYKELALDLKKHCDSVVLMLYTTLLVN